jgi:hypothetical protein
MERKRKNICIGEDFSKLIRRVTLIQRGIESRIEGDWKLFFDVLLITQLGRNTYSIKIRKAVWASKIFLGRFKYVTC